MRKVGLNKILRTTGLRLNCVEARGEAIPELVASCSGACVGVTGDDLYQEYLAGGGTPLGFALMNLSRKGKYQKALFGLPALCILGRNGATPEVLRRFPLSKTEVNTQCKAYLSGFRGGRVIYPTRYESLIKKRIAKTGVRWIPCERKADVTAATDASIDYAVDIVLSGKTCSEAGLGIEAVLYLSDGVMLANLKYATTTEGLQCTKQ
ncbi:hypothetical protein HY642_06980 [Candidatus Woesearchaeota archaeon]|nr:hypothetical protein [Candidatus Woesearchaeota archaeon]